jgi:D-alanyl-D-alanine carboxypeptidase
MRYQALLLIFIVLISSYLLKETSVFSQGGTNINDQGATIVDTLNLGSSPQNIKNSEQGIKTIENTQTANQSQQSNDNKIGSDSVIIEKPIIEETTSSINDLCVPIEARIFLVQTIDGASILYEKNSQDRWPIASITKLMTSIVALENINQSSVIKITSAIEEEVGSNNTFAVGDSYTANDLLKAMLSASSNDAAYALAQSVGQNVFIQKMNDKAKELSMSQTDFYEPSGLSYLNQSTAHDLYLLLTYIKKHYPYILDITRQKSVTVKNQITGMRKTLVNIDDFAGRNDFFGGKTGFIDQSEGNLISLFSKNGKMVYIGILGSPDRFGETDKILSCLQ